MKFFDSSEFIGGDVLKALEKGAKRTLPEHPLVLDPYLRTEEFLNFLDNCKELYIEIGFGKGSFLREVASLKKEACFLGFETGHFLCLEFLEKSKYSMPQNLKIVNYDIRPVLDNFFKPASVDGFFVNFPDPWWKKKHKKKLLVKKNFIDAVYYFLKPDGFLSFVTDVYPYFKEVLTLFSEKFVETEEITWFSHVKNDREKRFKNLKVYRVIFKKKEGI